MKHLTSISALAAVLGTLSTHAGNTVEGGKRVSIVIPRPAPTTCGGYGNSGRSFTFFRDIAVLAVPAAGGIDLAKITDLTEFFKGDQLDWDAPAGKWQLVRLAQAPTGANPHPLPAVGSPTSRRPLPTRHGHRLVGHPLQSPSDLAPGRQCFVVWYYHRKDTKLFPAGLLGPVTLNPASLSPAKQ